MSTEKKIIFSATDNVSQTADSMYGKILANAKKYSDNLKEQTSYINAQVKSLEQRTKVEIRGGKEIVKEQNSLFQNARTPQEREKYSQRESLAQKGVEESQAVLEILKNIFQEERKQTIATEKAQQKRISDSEKRYQSMQSLARQEIRENRNGVRDKIKKAESDNYTSVDPTTAEKLMFQKTLIGKEREERSASGFKDVLAGTLVAGLMQRVAQVMQTAISSRTGEQAFNSLLGAIPFVGGAAAAAKEREFDEQYNTSILHKKLQAVTGRKIGGVGSVGLGYSIREGLGSTEQLINAAGTGNGYQKNLEQSRLLERGLGLDSQTITQIVKDIRTSQKASDVLSVVSAVLAANPELRKDQTKFAEILAQTSQLTNQLASQSEDINLKANAGIVGALRSIGGSFKDPTLGPQRMMAINSALTNPGSEYQKARGFGVLSSLKPGASYFQLREMEEKGIGQEGYLGGILKQFEKEGGGGENTMLQIKNNLGLNYSTSRKLYEAYKKNPNRFDNFKGSIADIEKDLNLTERAKGNTSSIDIDAAKQSDKYLKGVMSGAGESLVQTLSAAGSAITEFSDNVIGKDLTDAANKWILMLTGHSSVLADLTVKASRMIQESKSNEVYGQ